MLSHLCYKKYIRKFILTIGIVIFSSISSNTQSYYFGLKSADNTPENIQDIESKLNIKLPIISFIFDPRNKSDVLNSIDKIVDQLGTDRIYHFTVSPDSFSAEDVALGKFDEQYTAFFKKIKEKDLHVIFRTMHEMNGGRYPRASNPEKFKAAWIHVWTLSRVVGLREENIAFDFSVNHRDMPTKGIPSQSAQLIECSLSKKGCYHFEDYYPGDEFVDLIGFTFYNRGKAVDNRRWLSPTEILYDKNWKTYERLQKFGKPIIIDEVATTSVWYKGNYSYEKSRNEYLNVNNRKDYRLHQLREFLIDHPEIVATIYFNCDYTHGLNFIVQGEADRAIVNLQDDKTYAGFRDLELFGEKRLDDALKTIFHLGRIKVDNNDILISSQCMKEISVISSLIEQKAETIDEKVKLLNTLQEIDWGSECISKSLNALMNVYTKG